MSGKWLFREGVGASPVNPALWDDPSNWEEGQIPSGRGATADLRSGDQDAIVWVRIPDDVTVPLTYIEGAFTNATFRIFGGAIKAVDLHSNEHARFRINSFENGIDRGIKASTTVTVYSDVICEDGNLLRLNVFSLAGALRFAPTAELSSSYVPVYLADSYAESGAERRNVLGSLTRVRCNHQWRIDSPGVGEETSGTWRGRAGSRVLERVSGATGLSLVPGQAVVAEGIPEGAYIRYIYGEDFIELSEAPALSETTDLACSFARHAPKLSHTFASVTVEGTNGQIVFGRMTAENEFVLRIDALSGDNLMTDYPKSLYYLPSNTIDGFPGPGVLEIVDASAQTGYLETRASHLRILPPSEGVTEVTYAGVRNSQSSSYVAYARGRIDVVEGLTATFAQVPDWRGYLYKAGAGTAVFRTTCRNLSLLRVEEGTCVLDPQVEGTTISMLTVQSGGRFRLAEGKALRPETLKVNAGGRLEYYDGLDLPLEVVEIQPGGIVCIPAGKTLSFDPSAYPAGTVFEGPGQLLGLPKESFGDYGFSGGIQVHGGVPVGNLVLGPQGSELPTRVSPAFWVSAKAEDSLVTDANGTVIRWNDCRGGADQGYHFATNSGTLSVSQGVFPKAWSGPCIQVRHNKDVIKTVNSPADVPALVWDSPITGIKSVFVIMRNGYDGQNGGGALLGSTERLATCDFARSGWSDWWRDRFDGKLASPNVFNAPFYLNGRLPPAEVQVSGKTYQKVMMTFANAEQLVECHPLGEGASADCWGYQNAIRDGYGAWIGECMIFTEELTRAEQMQVSNYLLNKWFGSSLMYSSGLVPGQNLTTLGDGAITVDAGEALCADSVVAPTGTLTKDGPGALYLEDVHASGLSVKAGEVVVTSYDAADPANLPEGAALHLDATDDDSFPGLVSENGVEVVGKWYDTDAPDTNPIHLFLHSAARRNPTRLTETEAFVRPMKIVDYGPLKTSKDDGVTKDASGWWFTGEECCAHAFTTDDNGVAEIRNLRAVAGVWGSKYGGNQLVGGWHQKGDGLRREMTNSVEVAANIACPIIGRNPTGTRWDGPTDLCYGSFCLKNGEEVVPGATGLSGSWDVVSVRTDYASKVTASSVAGYGNRAQIGGVQLGELLLYNRDVTEDEIRRIDAYLNHKWFGRGIARKYLPAEIGSVDVAAGSTLRVQGGAPIRVDSVGGGGTIDGGLAFGAAGAPVLDVSVAVDGSVPCLTVTGRFPSEGGVVRLSGHVGRLAGGNHRLLACPALAADANWTLELPEGFADDRISLSSTDGFLRLRVAKGLIVVFR